MRQLVRWDLDGSQAAVLALIRALMQHLMEWDAGFGIYTCVCIPLGSRFSPT